MSIAPIEPVDQPEPPRYPQPPRHRSSGLEALFAVAAAVAVAALGAPVGLLWTWVAPKVELVQTAYGPYPVDGEPEGYFADDGWFVIISVGAGIVLAVVAWLVLRRYRGPLVLLGLVVGSVGGSVLAAWLGNRIGYAHYLDLVQHAPVDTQIMRPVKLRTGASSLLFGFLPWVRGTMLVQAIAVAAAYTGLAGFHAAPSLQYDEDEAPQEPQPTGYLQPDYAQYQYPQPQHPQSGQPQVSPAGDPEWRE